MFPYTLPKIQIIESSYCVKAEKKTVPRSWTERLFNWPWKPWQKEKTITIYIPLLEVFQIKPLVFVCHPTVAQRIRERMKEEGMGRFDNEHFGIDNRFNC